MLKDTIAKINRVVSGDRMLERIREISSYHRIQASEGYRAAAVQCRDKLQEYGIKSEILSYAAQNDISYMTMGAFQEWRCREAYCDLILPTEKRIADFNEDNLSIIQKSFACDYRSTPLDIVLLDRGYDKSKYGELDVTGKIIFVRDNFNSYLDWIEKYGAVGIITDYIAEAEGGRTRYDLIDIKRYNTFWWTKNSKGIRPFGFVLTPRAGDRLAEACRKLRDENDTDSTKPRYPQVNCFIDSDFYDGYFENVSATLPGEIDEEILITAHLCHPRLSANDNASGVSAAMEVLNTLRILIDKGALPPLKRTVRILLIPEFTGLYAYLASIGDDKSKIKAAINLDMVGGKQEKGYGPLTISGLPRSTPSFVMDLAILILDELKKEVPGFSTGSLVPMFNSAIAEFTCGSDNFILSDPSVGIPTPMLGQWPDMYYHTNGDTPEIISTKLLSKSATLAAAYAYTLANLSEHDLLGIFGKAFIHMQEELTELQSRALRGEITKASLVDEYAHYTEYYIKACKDYLRFFSGEELIRVKNMIANETNRITQAADNMLAYFYAMVGEQQLAADIPEDSKHSYVPCRKFIAPVNQLMDFAEGSDMLKDALNQYSKRYRSLYKDSYYAELLTQYYIDGKRTAAEIAKKVIMDCRSGEAEAVYQYIQLLKMFNLVDFIESESNNQDWRI